MATNYFTFKRKQEILATRVVIKRTNQLTTRRNVLKCIRKNYLLIQLISNSNRTLYLYLFQMYLMTKLGHRKQFITEIMEDKYKIHILNEI
jgi:hypothetical protein